MKINPEIREQKFAMIRRWQESGITQKQFAEQENISMNHFQYWYKRFKKVNESAYRQDKKKSEKFIKLKAPEKNIFLGNVFSEVVFANGNRVKFYNAIEVSQLKQLAQ